MTEKDYNSEIKELKSEIIRKNQVITQNLDRIESLEDFIMEIEADLKRKPETSEIPLLRIQLKGLERKNKEMKKSLGLLRLDNIKLKQELESYKKGYFENISLVQIRESNSDSNEFANNSKMKQKTKNTHISQEELFDNVNVKCPICEIKKIIRIPTKLINPFQNTKTIHIPKGILCEHSIQIQLDKSLAVERYQIVNLESKNVEVFDSKERGISREGDEKSSNLMIPRAILNGMRNLIDGREILGISVFDSEWNLLFASLPADLKVNIIKEFYIRKERQNAEMTKMYIEFKDHQKCFSKSVDISGEKFVLFLLFSGNVNYGMGAMLFKEIEAKLTRLN